MQLLPISLSWQPVFDFRWPTTVVVWQLATRCLILGVGFEDKLCYESIAEIQGLRDVAMASNVVTV